MLSTKFHPNPTPYAGVTLDSDSKSTNLPLNQPNFRFRSYSQGSTGAHRPCQRTRPHRYPTPYVRATVVLLNEKVSVHTISNWKRRWRIRVTVSHLKIVTNTHFFAFFSLPQGAREVRPCAPTRACPPPHVLPPRLSCTTQPSWAPRHSLCWRWHFSQPVNTLWSPSCCYAGSCDFLNFCVMHPVVPSMCAVSVATIGWCVWAWKITH